MAEVRGFRGIRYAGETGSDLSRLVSPPYDVISPEQQRQLLDRHPRNVVRLELPPADGDPYAGAARTYAAWKEEGDLVRDAQPSLYVYGQEFRDAAGERRRRLGLFGALRLSPYEEGVVLPHERTFPKHKEDRFRLLCAAEAQFSPIFALYDAGGEIRPRLEAAAAGAPAAGATLEEVRHLVWVVPEAEAAEWLAASFAERSVYIADGHHRYETALRYQRQRRAAEPDAPPSWFDYLLVYLVEAHDPGLVCEPTHRVATSPTPPLPEVERRLREQFEFHPLPAPPAAVEPGTIGLLLPEAATLLRPRGSLLPEPEGRLEVALLHRVILPRLYGEEAEPALTYTHSAAEARDALAGGARAAFLLPPPRLEDLRAMAAAGLKMPQKSTYFWPKALTGLVFYDNQSL